MCPYGESSRERLVAPLGRWGCYMYPVVTVEERDWLQCWADGCHMCPNGESWEYKHQSWCYVMHTNAILDKFHAGYAKLYTCLLFITQDLSYNPTGLILLLISSDWGCFAKSPSGRELVAALSIFFIKYCILSCAFFCIKTNFLVMAVIIASLLLALNYPHWTSCSV